MKGLLVISLLALALPVAVWADGIDLTNQYGTVTILNSGITTRGSEMTSFNGIQAPQHHSLGTVKFGTGALLTGSIWTGGAFSAVGSFFDVTGRGVFGMPGGAIFTGAFVGPISWTIVSQTGVNNVEHELSGAIAGTIWTGRYVTGTTAQYIQTYKNQEIADHKGSIVFGQMQGQTHMNTAEPATLVLLGTGFVGIGGAVRRKTRNSSGALPKTYHRGVWAGDMPDKELAVYRDRPMTM